MSVEKSLIGDKDFIAFMEELHPNEKLGDPAYDASAFLLSLLHLQTLHPAKIATYSGVSRERVDEYMKLSLIHI